MLAQIYTYISSQIFTYVFILPYTRYYSVIEPLVFYLPNAFVLLNYLDLKPYNRIGAVMFSMIASSVVDFVFEPRSC
jgi:hypothetical protein